MICKSLTWPVKRVSLRNTVEKRNISQNACQLRRKIIEQCFWNSTALIPQDSITWTVLALNSCSALDTCSRYLPIRLQSVGKYFHYTVPHYSFEGLLLSVSPAQGTCQEKKAASILEELIACKVTGGTYHEGHVKIHFREHDSKLRALQEKSPPVSSLTITFWKYSQKWHFNLQNRITPHQDHLHQIYQL